MTDLLITNAHIYAEGNVSNTWLAIRDGKIDAYGRGEPPTDAAKVIDAAGQHLLPGFVDIHVHGGDNADTMDAKPESIQQMARFYARHGVTSFLATTWTDNRENITAALENVASCLGPQPDGATLRGVHLEGPYLNPNKSGAQSTQHIRTADRAEANQWLDLDVIRVVSLAPEYTENHWLIEECAKRGITVSAAHTNASYEDMTQAVSLGVSHCTHTFNAMSGLHHRRPGVVGAALSIPELTCEIIADNIHVHPAVQRLLWNAKHFQNVVLVTDAIRAAGMPDGDYPIDERTVQVREGVAQLEDGTLAGSTLTMDAALRNFLKAMGSSLDLVYEAATLTPARVAGIADVTGSIELGKDADLVLLNDKQCVQATIIHGVIVYKA